MSNPQPTPSFRDELEDLINRHSQENGSNTPDFILAEYLTDCIIAWNKASRAREKWYGKSLSINDFNIIGQEEST